MVAETRTSRPTPPTSTTGPRPRARRRGPSRSGSSLQASARAMAPAAAPSSGGRSRWPARRPRGPLADRPRRAGDDRPDLLLAGPALAGDGLLDRVGRVLGHLDEAPASATRMAPRASAIPIAARLTGWTNHDSTAAAATACAAARAATPSWIAAAARGEACGAMCGSCRAPAPAAGRPSRPPRRSRSRPARVHADDAAVAHAGSQSAAPDGRKGRDGPRGIPLRPIRHRADDPRGAAGAGADPEAPTLDDLAPVEHFHTRAGGRASTSSASRPSAPATGCSTWGAASAEGRECWRRRPVPRHRARPERGLRRGGARPDPAHGLQDRVDLSTATPSRPRSRTGRSTGCGPSTRR